MFLGMKIKIKMWQTWACFCLWTVGGSASPFCGKEHVNQTQGIINLRNSLPQDAVRFTSTDGFKRGNGSFYGSEINPWLLAMMHAWSFCVQRQCNSECQLLGGVTGVEGCCLHTLFVWLPRSNCWTTWAFFVLSPQGSSACALMFVSYLFLHHHTISKSRLWLALPLRVLKLRSFIWNGTTPREKGRKASGAQWPARVGPDPRAGTCQGQHYSLARCLPRAELGPVMPGNNCYPAKRWDFC